MYIDKIGYLNLHLSTVPIDDTMDCHIVSAGRHVLGKNVLEIKMRFCVFQGIKDSRTCIPRMMSIDDLTNDIRCKLISNEEFGVGEFILTFEFTLPRDFDMDRIDTDELLSQAANLIKKTY